MIGAPSNVLQLAEGLLRPTRSIGTLYPDVVVEETHFDFLRVTEHPVERGANIADHCFKAPADLFIRCGWSNSSVGNVGLGLLPANPFAEFSGKSYSQEIYAALLRLQGKRQPLEVFTGKRYYKNMVITSITVITDHKSEYALLAQLRLREVLIVNTRAAVLPDKANQKAPASTGGQIGSGPKQPAPVASPPPGVG